MEPGDMLRSLLADADAGADDDPTGPGMVLVACTPGAVAVEAVGMSLLEHARPLTATTPLYAASLAKLVTARCVHLLVADGALALDDSVDRWFPALDAAGSITVRQLLLHRSGLPEYHALRLLAGASVDDRLDPDDVRRLVDGMETWFTPGSRVSYNNTNYAMLAAVVAAVSGQRFSDAVSTLVFEPAGMTTASVRRHADDLVSAAAQGYVPHAAGFRRAILGASSVGDGGMWWSGTDLGALGQVLLSDDEAVRAMRERVPLPDGTVPGLATGCTVGEGGAWFGALAEFTGFRAELRVYDGVAIGAMSNRQDAATGPRLDALAAASGLPARVVAAPPQRRTGAFPDGVLVGVGGAPWRFRPVDAGTAPVPAAVGHAEVGEVSFHLVADGIGWVVAERPSVTAAWEADEFVVRDGAAEIARLRSMAGEPAVAGHDDRLSALAGWWWCPPAQAVLRIARRGDDLWLHRGHRAPERLVHVGSHEGRSVLAAPWGLLEIEPEGLAGRVVLHRAEGLRLDRIDRGSRSG